MVMFPDIGMSGGNGSMRPLEMPRARDAPKFKARSVSAIRKFPHMCGPENEHFKAESEETAAMSGGENVAMNFDSIGGVMTGSGVQDQPDGAGTSTGLEVQENAGLQFSEPVEKPQEANGAQMLPIEEWENYIASKKLLNSGGWDNGTDTVNGTQMLPIEEWENYIASKKLLNSGGHNGTDTVNGTPTLPLEEWENYIASQKLLNSGLDNGTQMLPLEAGENHLASEQLLNSGLDNGTQMLPLEAGENHLASEQLLNSGGWDNGTDTVNGAQMLPLEAWKNHLASKKMVNSAGIFNRGDAAAIDTFDSDMEIEVEEERDEPVNMMVDEMSNQMVSTVKDVETESVKDHESKSMHIELPKEVQPSVEEVRSKVRDVLHTYRSLCRKLMQGKEARFEEGSNAKEKIRRIDYEAAKILKQQGKEVNTEPHHFIGPVPGVEVGDEFQYRVELAIVGIHRIYQGGIDYATLDGQKVAVSIVASGGYDDDLGDPNVLIYSGQGGNPGIDKQAEDQKLERGNLALWNSKTLKNPVRVVRGTKETDQDKSKIVTKYVYDGLYTVEDHWQETGEYGNLVYMFKLRRNDGQPEVAREELKGSKKAATESVNVRVRVDDIAQEAELYPIGVVNTVDDEKPPAFNYIHKVIYPGSLQLPSGKGCSCTGECAGSRCSCAVRNGGEIPYNRNGAIKETKYMVYECGPHCKCPLSCYNRVSQDGIKIPLEVFKTDDRGWGVRALSSISSGSFICEYIGDILDGKEAEERMNHEYQLNIGGLGYFTIDALKYGNVGRFINHSCSPNCYAQNVLYDHDDKRVPHIMIFASENIPPLQELTFDYHYSMHQVAPAKVKECRCGETGCTGRLF